jgi:hypothetical protein
MAWMEESGPPALRAADADRERVVASLRDHLVTGRLTLDEFSERVDAAHAARTIAELDELVGDLPGGARPARTSERKTTRWTVAIMGSARRTSRWRVAEHTAAVAVMGDCRLDLRKAEIPSSEIEITAIAVMGDIEVIVPEGVEVELTGVALMGSKDERVSDVPPLAGTPLIRVRAFALMGDVTVSSEPGSRGQRPPPPPPGLPPPGG